MSQDDTPGPVAASPIHPAVQQQLDALNKAFNKLVDMMLTMEMKVGWGT